MFENTENALPARSAGRVVFGLVLIAGALLTAARALQPGPIHAAAILTATWTLAFVAAAATRGVVARRGTAPGRWLGPSLVVPSIGIALVLPLTIHMPFALALGSVHSFDEWVELGVGITGPAHLVLAALVAIRAAQLASGRVAPLSTGAIYLTTVVVSCIPYAVFVLPPAIVAVTGLGFLPLFRYQATLATRERDAVALAPPLATVLVAPRVA